jgi:hypothetical protein
MALTFLSKTKPVEPGKANGAGNGAAKTGKFIGGAIPNIELGGILRYFLRQLGRQWLEPAPTQVKKFVIGGQGQKDQMMMWVLKRWGHTSKNDDTADAYGLAAMGLGFVGRLPGLIKPQREVIGLLKLL